MPLPCLVQFPKLAQFPKEESEGRTGLGERGRLRGPLQPVLAGRAPRTLLLSQRLVDELFQYLLEDEDVASPLDAHPLAHHAQHCQGLQRRELNLEFLHRLVPGPVGANAVGVVVGQEGASLSQHVAHNAAGGVLDLGEAPAQAEPVLAEDS